MRDYIQWIEEKLLQINLVDSMHQAEGFSRLGYTKQEQQAQEQFQLIAQSIGLKTHQDAAGNQWAIWEVDNKAGWIATGSHVDTVYNGGGYDGAAGVVASLASVKMLKDELFTPQKNIAVIAFACEESARFSVSTIGSKAICGLLDKDKVATFEDSNGITLKKAITNCGLDWDTIQNARLEDHQLEQFIELHIEQATRLEKSKKEIGIVRAIAQPTRLLITCTGRTNHTGTTPMNERQDALVSIAPLISFIEESATEINNEQTVALVATVSTIQNRPNSMSMIPGEVILGIDIRSTKAELKHKLVKNIEQFVQLIESNKPVSITIKTLVDDQPTLLDQEIQKTLIRICEKLDLSSMSLDSGAGHDVMNMAKRWPSGLLFIPCRDGISHHPLEHAKIEDLLKGSRVLAEFLKETTNK